jgi:hypothetical protein
MKRLLLATAAIVSLSAGATFAAGVTPAQDASQFRPLTGNGTFESTDVQPGRSLETLARPSGHWISEDGVGHGIRPINDSGDEPKEHRYQLGFSASPLNGGPLELVGERVISAANLQAAIRIGLEHLATRGYTDAQVVGVHFLN